MPCSVYRGSVTVSKPRTWKWRKKPDIFALIIGLLWLLLAIFTYYRSNDNEFAVFWVIIAACNILRAFIIQPEPEPDPRPLKERYIEQLQKCSDEELQKILDDSLRGDDVKQVARDVLKGRGYGE